MAILDTIQQAFANRGSILSLINEASSRVLISKTRLIGVIEINLDILFQFY